MINDPRFQVNVLSATPNPQQTVYAALHQCYSEGNVSDLSKLPNEKTSGELAVKHLLAGNRGHFSPTEANAITFNVVGFPHSVMQQYRTHRVGVSFSVQSFRYTGEKIYRLGKLCRDMYYSFPSLEEVMTRIQDDIEQVFYLRPVGEYSDRSGKRYEYSEKQRVEDLGWCGESAISYLERINQGFSEEQSRSVIPFDVRQNWVFTCNARSLMHVCDLRYKKDAQLEAQTLAEMLLQRFSEWMPEIAQWYMENRAMRARLSP